MRVVVAPDSFGGTLSAVEAAEAIATGWRRGAPTADLDLVPLADGGPGFVDVLYNVLGGDLLPVTVRDPLARPTPAAVLLFGDTAYLESAQACGLHLLAPDERDPTVTSSYGVGQLLTAALDSGAARIVVGLGGSGTNDGGRGMLDALGLRAAPGGAVDRSGLDPRLTAVEVVAATDVTSPLLGPTGATTVFGPQKGARPETLALLEARMRRWAEAFDPTTADRAGAGAAGGLGFALLAIGGTRVSGVELVADVVGLPGRVAVADLVVTGEGRYDEQSLAGKVCGGVAEVARRVGVPCLVLAGQVCVDVTDRPAGVSAYAVADELGSVAAALADASGGLSRLAERVAREHGVPR